MNIDIYIYKKELKTTERKKERKKGGKQESGDLKQRRIKTRQEDKTTRIETSKNQ